jgi:hypothetical protein
MGLEKDMALLLLGKGEAIPGGEEAGGGVFMRLEVVAEVFAGAESGLEGGPEAVPVEGVTGLKELMIESAEEGVVDMGGADAASGDDLGAAAAGENVFDVGGAAATAKEDEPGGVREELPGGVKVVVVAAVDEDAGSGGKAGRGVREVGMDFDAAGVAGAAAEKNTVGETLEGPMRIVGVGGEEALEGLDTVVVVVEDVALETDAVGEEIGDVQGGLGGLTEVLEDAAERGIGEGVVDGGRGGGEDNGGL